jgi:hypothetical protein
MIWPKRSMASASRLLSFENFEAFIVFRSPSQGSGAENSTQRFSFKGSDHAGQTNASVLAVDIRR